MTSDQSAASRKPANKQKKTYGKNVKSHISGWFGRDLWSAVEPTDPKKAKEKDAKKEKEKRRSVEEDELDVEKQLAREAEERERASTGAKRASTASTDTMKTDEIPGTPEHEELEANILELLKGVQKLDMAKTPATMPPVEDDDDDLSDDETNTPNNTPATLDGLDSKSTISLNSDKENDEPHFPSIGSRRASHKRSSDVSREALKERSISPERDPEPLEPLVESPARKNGVRKKGSLVHRMSGVSITGPTSPLKKETSAPEIEKAESIKVWEDQDGENTMGKPERPKSLVEARNKPKDRSSVVEIPNSEDEREGRRREIAEEHAKVKPMEAPQTPKEKALTAETPFTTPHEEPSTEQEEGYDSDTSELTAQDNSDDDFPLDDLLRLCTDPRILDFTEHTTTLHSHSTLTKLGEASYSEVFLQTTPSSTPTLTPPISTVLKIIPFGGPDQCALPSIIQEVSITRSMCRIPGYIGFRGAFVVRGSFPERLMDEWDAYEEERGSENERPEFYEEDQLFAVICLEMGGRDLEHFELRGWEEAGSVFWQVAVALGRGERELEFEHRDLHFGNIVIRREPDEEEESDYDVDSEDDENTAPEKMLGKLSLEEKTPEKLFRKLSLEDEKPKPVLIVSLIDYTLSRAICGIEQEDVHIQHSPLDDPALFTGKGDYQFDIYRFMRTQVSSGLVPPEEEDIDWNVYAPKTNVFWLHYLTNILLNKKGIPRPAARGRNAASEEEKKAYKELEAVAKLIDPRKKRFGGKGEIGSAQELVQWAIEQGIVGNIWGWDEVVDV